MAIVSHGGQDGSILGFSLWGLCYEWAGLCRRNGGRIVEFTGGTTQIFDAMRATTFVRATGIALFALLLIAGFGGYVSGGWTTVLGGLLILGGWFGAEPIVDTIFASGAAVI